jgi:hypothetical protein
VTATGALGVALLFRALDKADAGLAVDAAALHRLRQRGVRHERARGFLAREVVVDYDAVGVVDVLVDAVLELAVAAPHVLVLVEDRLPGGEVSDPVMNDERDHESSCARIIYLARQINIR